MSASPWTTRTFGRSATTSSSAGIMCRSSSSAVTDAPVSASATVSEPTPGPISSTWSPAPPRRAARSAGRCSDRRGSAGPGPGSAAGRGVRAARRSTPESAEPPAHARRSGATTGRRSPGWSATRRGRCSGRCPGSAGRAAGRRPGARSMMCPVQVSGPRSCTRHCATAPGVPVGQRHDGAERQREVGARARARGRCRTRWPSRAPRGRVGWVPLTTTCETGGVRSS